MSQKLFPIDRPYHPIFALISLVILFTMVSLGVLLLLGKMHGVNYLDPLVMENPSLRTIEVQLLVQHVMIFILPGALTIYIFPRLRRIGYFSLTNVNWEIVGWVTLLFVIGIPIVGVLNWLNMQIPLSGNMEEMESQVNGIIKTLLGSGSIPLVVFMIGFIPAIGEELVFRGVIQKSLENWTKRPHLAILLSGAIFSLIHLQFAGFLPRMFLGILLGYAYYFTGTILVPMFLHFMFNASQAIAMVVKPELLSELGSAAEAELPPWWAILLAFVTFVYVFGLLIQKNQRQMMI